MQINDYLNRLQTNRNLFVVISGPSGVGKDAIFAHMKYLRRPYHFAVTCTTRPRRPNEIDGVDYIFVTKEKFSEMVDQQEFLEYATVYGNSYGVPRGPLTAAIKNKQDIVIKTDVQGAATLKKLVPNGTFVMLLPPNEDILRKRLTQRGTETLTELQSRLSQALSELQESPIFTHTLVNIEGDVPTTVMQLENILTAERARVDTDPIQL
tara:strand:+ start:1445 stop:2071 length:627 start_codon:yes stop_codon:yes gene_type:complete